MVCAEELTIAFDYKFKTKRHKLALENRVAILQGIWDNNFIPNLYIDD